MNLNVPSFVVEVEENDSNTLQHPHTASETPEASNGLRTEGKLGHHSATRRICREYHQPYRILLRDPH